MKAASMTPEIDTIRLQWHCGKLFDIDAFFNGEGTKKILVLERSPETGEISTQWEKIRADHRKSWYGKMQIIDDRYTWGEKGENWERCLTFEFSVAKWFCRSNGLNSGIAPKSWVAFRIVADVLRSLGAISYSKFKDYSAFRKHFFERTIIRRLDLSLNFQVPQDKSVTEWIAWLGRVVVNGNESLPQGNEKSGSARVWSAPRSNYRITFYDKEKEQAKFFAIPDYAQTEKERSERLKFYEKVKPLLKNVLRFEIQFKSGYFRDLTKLDRESKLKEKPFDELTEQERLRLAIVEKGIMGAKNSDNVIRFGVCKWRQILEMFQKQLDYTNFTAGSAKRIQDNSGAEYVLEKIDEELESGLISYSLAANRKAFLLDCYKYGWKKIRAKMSAQLWYAKRRQILSNYGYDVKVSLPAECPIMAIM